ncbi:D-alanyl-D-alanine carboxypeptidase/D-alanyl-D-alanine-endopeptidase [Bacteroidota bacterium]
MKSFLYLIISLVLVSPLKAQSHSSLTSQIEDILSNEFFETSTVAIDIYDLTDNKSLYKKNHKLLLRPASNLKLLTSAAGLLFLGPDYKFKTSFYHTGQLRDSVCYGDFFVVGGFDPEFSSADLDSVIQLIKNFGIKEIRGNLYGDVSLMDSLHWGAGWMWDDDPYIFSPYLSSLSINKNGIKIAYESAAIGFPAKVNIIPESGYYSLSNSSYTSIEDTSDISIIRDFINHTNKIIIDGSLSFRAEPDTSKLNLVHPEKYFLTLMKENLERRGMNIEGMIDTATLKEDTTFITSIERSLIDVLNNLNKESDNLNAELVLRALAYENFGKPASAENGIKMIDSLLTLVGLDSVQYRMTDGSGLSFYNLFSVEIMNELLKYMYLREEELFTHFYDSLPIAGVDGKLEKRMMNGAVFNNVRAKTGTLSGISCLSGYLTTKNAHFISFSIFIQNYVGSSERASSFQDRICRILCEMNDAKP